MLPLCRARMFCNSLLTWKTAIYTAAAIVAAVLHPPVRDRDGTMRSQIFARSELGFIAGRKGFVYGPLLWTTDDGDRLNAQNGTGTSIEPRVDNITHVYCQDADCIIVVEKETVFHRCVNEVKDILPRAIFITGKGYPDVGTRLFLNFLLRHPQVTQRNS